jgi:glutamine synthetase
MNSNVSPQYYTFEYIWYDASGAFRSKVRIVHCSPTQINMHMRADWNYDGSSTGYTTTQNSEIILHPVATYTDRSRERYYYLLCESILQTQHLDPRHQLERLFNQNQVSILEPWFGFEQEFFILDKRTNHILGTNPATPLPPQGPYYCGVQLPSGYNYATEGDRGIDRTRELTEAIVKRCMDIGVGVTGWNLEVAPGQTEIQVFGHGLRACDDLMMMRYMAYRVLASHHCEPDFRPKPLGSAWNGSGMHTNVSTVQTRAENGMDVIQGYMSSLKQYHTAHIAVYGEGNEERLTGHHETSSMETFTHGIGDRTASVRIPTQTMHDGRGYFEDRRPAANANPYIVAERILKTIAGLDDPPMQQTSCAEITNAPVTVQIAVNTQPLQQQQSQPQNETVTSAPVTVEISFNNANRRRQQQIPRN